MLAFGRTLIYVVEIEIEMRTIVTDRVAWSVCMSVTVVSPAKTAEPIEVPFGPRVGPRNHVLDGVLILRMGWAILGGRRDPL